MSRVIVVTSGKGGTGKTSVTGGVASCLAALGRKVVCVDADIGLRNLDIVLGMSDKAALDFYDVITGTPLDRAVAGHPDIAGLFMLAAPPQPITPPPPEHFAHLAEQLKERFDYCLIDCPAGFGQGFKMAASCADEAIVVSTPDVVSLRDAQFAGELLGEMGISERRLVVNRVRSRLIKLRDAYDIDDAIDMTGLRLLGVVPDDDAVIACANHGVPVILLSDDGAATAYYNIACRLEGKTVPVMKMKKRYE